MQTYKIHLIRTGKTADGLWKRYVGQNDVPLCDKGVDGLNALLRQSRYPDVDMVFTSPLQRCRQTADILYPESYVESLPDLMDMNLGVFEGKTFEELRGDKSFSLWIDNSFENSPPGGEQTADFTKRIVSAAGEVFARMMEERMQSVAVVTHGGVIMTLLAAIGLPQLPLHQWAVDNGCGYTLLMSTHLWMRDQKCEVFQLLPLSLEEDSAE